MFTLDQIQAIHHQVRSGADFPQYVQNLQAIGLTSYDQYLTDGHAHYVGAAGFSLTSPPTGPRLPLAGPGSAAQLNEALKIHQQGQTDYPTFCRQVVEAGVEKWTVDILNLTCTYYDPQGAALVVEAIPLPQ